MSINITQVAPTLKMAMALATTYNIAQKKSLHVLLHLYPPTFYDYLKAVFLRPIFLIIAPYTTSAYISFQLNSFPSATINRDVDCASKIRHF